MSCGCEVREERVGHSAKELEAHLTLVRVVDGGGRESSRAPRRDRAGSKTGPTPGARGAREG